MQRIAQSALIRSTASKLKQPHLMAAIVLCVSIVAYQPVLQYSFFWEDPFDIGQALGLSVAQMFGVSNSNSYYRPLSLALMQLLSGTGPAHAALPFHLANVTAHCMAAVALFGAARHWFNDSKTAFVAALLFALYPPAFEATARASSVHSIMVLLTITVLWLYTLWREKGGRLRIAAALVLTTAAMFLQENGILIPALVLALELYFLVSRKVARLHPLALLFLIPAGLFIVVWISVPKPTGEFTLAVRLTEGLYLSQGLSYPFARLIALLGWFSTSPETQAAVALAATIGVLALATTRTARPVLTLALVWWAITSSLAWLARDMSYLEVSPRVMYFPSFGAALAWACIISGIQLPRLQASSLIRGTIALLIIVQSAVTLHQASALYAQGSRLMEQIIAFGQQGGRQLFINVPDRFAYREPLYPLGYWGMLLAPVSQELGEFVHFTTGVQMEARSLSNLELSKSTVDASPYQVNTRGENTYASEQLYENLIWADRTLWTDYHPDGSMSLREVGAISALPSSGASIGRIGTVADVISATAELTHSQLLVTVFWRSLATARPTDTIFVHVLDKDNTLVAQQDGDSLNGMTPPSAWRTGHEIRDVRLITPDTSLPPGTYRVVVGMYNRATSDRYPAFDLHGKRQEDNSIEVARVILP